MNPKVTFVVPCYKLAHLLPECVDSILRQSFENWELLIMDDCSPDNTSEVAGSFRDARIKYIRNEPNLGHLRNYNKGIAMARGEYVWLISADDCLRSPHILQRYVEVMDAHPGAGYVFCPGVGLQDGQETGLLKYSYHSDKDFVMNGREFILKRLMEANTVIAAAGMVRKECYEKMGMFPLDMPYAGDWYLWCRFALRYDVAYLAEPMVCYRLHALSMTTTLLKDQSFLCVEDDLAFFWRIAKDASELHQTPVVSAFESALAKEYGQYLQGPHRRSSQAVSLQDVAASVERMGGNPSQRNRVRALIFAFLADHAYEAGNRDLAITHYRQSIQADSAMSDVRLKILLLQLGSVGDRIRGGMGALRRLAIRMR